MKKKVPAWTLLLLSIPLLSKAMDGITLLEVSSSKRSIMIDRGSEFHQIHPGQFAKFYVQDSVDYPHTVFVAEGEAIKVHENFSYWYLRKIENPKLLEQGKKLEFINESDIFSGRKPIQVDERRVVLRSRQKKSDELFEEERGVPETFIKKDQAYLENTENVKTIVPASRDVLVTDYGRWDEMKSESKEDLSGEVLSKKSSLLGEKIDVSEKKKIAKDYKKEIFDSSTEGFNLKINAHADPLLALYGANKEQKTGYELEPRSSHNLYNKVKENQEKSRIISDEDFEKIDRNDPRWSQEMSDKQLRSFFVESNIEREINRQRFAFDNAYTHEFMLRYAMGMTQKTNSTDSSNQGTAQGLDLSYEYHLMRMTSMLKDWTLEAGGSSGYNFYDVGYYNARSDEKLLHFGLNWYPLNGPSSINNLLWHVGLGKRFGSAELASDQFYSTYGYQLSSNYIQTGLKYRFSGGDDRTDILRFGMGINALLMSESISLSSNEPITEDEINGTITTRDTKFLLGVSFFF